MRHAGANRRSRNRGGNNRKSGPNRSQVFDSNGPEVRIRGTAHQICEKYMTLAKDAASSGDPVMAESYLQHAEHYQRMINSWNEQAQALGQQQQAEEKSGNVQDEDDLALPASILAAGADEAAKAQDGVLEDA